MPHIIAAMAQALGSIGDEVAFIEGEKKLTRKEALAYGMAVAERLEREDLGESRHVGILLPNGLGAVGAIYGCLLARAVASPMNPLLSPEELATLAKVGDIKVVISAGPLMQKVQAIGLNVVDLMQIAPTPDAAAKLPARLRELATEDASGKTAIILFTSGTTGTPKAAMLTHDNFLGQVKVLYPRLQCAEGDRLLGVLPIFHIFGMTGCIMLPSLKNLAIVWQQKFTPHGALKAITEDKTNYVLLVPAMYAVMIRLVKGAKEKGHPPDFSHVKAFVSGGAAMPMTVGGAWHALTGMPVYQGYGLTETSPVISVGPLGNHRAGTVGTVVDGVEVQIWDDDGKTMPTGEIGEIVVRGHCVMKGYYKNEQATSDMITPEGWLKTGDFGKVESDGHISITGRKKELIIVAGENVYPGEIEQVISAVPGVIDVAVVAGYDDVRGEYPRACVVVFPGDPESGAPAADKEKVKEGIHHICQSKLASFKHPREIEFMDALPRNTMGKVLKRELEKRAATAKV